MTMHVPCSRAPCHTLPHVNLRQCQITNYPSETNSDLANSHYVSPSTDQPGWASSYPFVSEPPVVSGRTSALLAACGFSSASASVENWAEYVMFHHGEGGGALGL